MGRHRKSPRLSFWSSQHPQVPPLGHDPSNRMKILFNMFSIFYLWEHAQSLVFEIDMITEILMIFDLLTSPQGHQFDPRMNSLLAFCSARHPRQFDMSNDHVCFFLTSLVPPALQSPTRRAWPRRLNKNPVWYVLYLSFVRTHTIFFFWNCLFVFVCLIWFFTSTQQSFSYAGRVFLGWTSTKLG